MTSQIRILLVDDMSIIMDIIISHLETMGHHFIYFKASNGREACKMALHVKPDLIIMDWEMPKMNGIDALNLLKKKTETKDIPVIISSGFSESINVNKALEAGAIDYIKKPIDPIELIARVRSSITITTTFKALKQKQKELEKEREKVEHILKGLMPEKILNEVKETGKSKPIRYKNTSIMFTDLVGFTKKTSGMSPKRLISELNDIFSAFDKIIKKYNCTRIKTIGDAYLAVSGLTDNNLSHAKSLINAAIEFRQFILERNMINPVKWEITTGINSGDVIGSLIGVDNFLFDIFGENVNTAARIQSYCKPMKIAVSESTFQLTKDELSYEPEGSVQLKGMKQIKLYHVTDVFTDQELVNLFDEFEVF